MATCAACWIGPGRCPEYAMTPMTTAKAAAAAAAFTSRRRAVRRALGRELGTAPPRRCLAPGDRCPVTGCGSSRCPVRARPATSRPAASRPAASRPAAPGGVKFGPLISRNAAIAGASPRSSEGDAADRSAAIMSSSGRRPAGSGARRGRPSSRASAVSADGRDPGSRASGPGSPCDPIPRIRAEICHPCHRLERRTGSKRYTRPRQQGRELASGRGARPLAPRRGLRPSISATTSVSRPATTRSMMTSACCCGKPGHQRDGPLRRDVVHGDLLRVRASSAAPPRGCHPAAPPDAGCGAGPGQGRAVCAVVNSQARQADSSPVNVR